MLLRLRRELQKEKKLPCRDLISMSQQENKQISNWSRNLHEGTKQDMMLQHKREVVTKDQISLQQKWCRDMNSVKGKTISSRHEIVVATQTLGTRKSGHDEDQIGLQQKRCCDKETLSRHIIQQRKKKAGRDMRLWS